MVEKDEDLLTLGKKQFRSRLIVGTGKYPTFEVMRDAIERSGAEIVTVAVRRVDLGARGKGSRSSFPLT